MNLFQFVVFIECLYFSLSYVLGDYGAVVSIGSEVTSYTAAYMPADLLDVPAARTHDNLCLVAAVLCIIGKLPTSVTTHSLRMMSAVVEDATLRDLLLALF